MLTTYAFNDFRNFIKSKILKAQYKIGTTWYDSTVSEINITTDGLVRAFFSVAPGQSCTVIGARLISTSNEIWCEKDISVVLEDSSVNLLVSFDFNITESE